MTLPDLAVAPPSTPRPPEPLREDAAPPAEESAERAVECERWIARARELVFSDPADAVRAARRAVGLAEELAAEEPAAQRWADLEARACAFQANAERVADDLDAASALLRRADRCAAAGSGDPVLRARLLDLRASLERDQGHLEHALELVEEAVAVYARQRARRHLGRALVQRAVLQAHAGRCNHSLDSLRRAFEHLEPQQEPRSVLAATQCLAFCLHRVGYDIAASQLVDEARATVEHLGDDILLLRLRWLQARIMASLGHDREGELRAVRDAFLEQGLVYDAALASIDLAILFARQRRLPDLRHLAREMFPLFTSRRIHREALAALVMLRDGLSSGRAEPGFLDELRAFLERSRYDRSLRFRGS